MKIKTKHIITCIKCLFLGLVMALPFIAVLPTALYYGFNEHATTTDNYKYEYETNELNTIDDLKEGNIYKIFYCNYYDDATLYKILNNSFLDFNTTLNILNYVKIELANATNTNFESGWYSEEVRNELYPEEQNEEIVINYLTYTKNNIYNLDDENIGYYIEDLYFYHVYNEIEFYIHFVYKDFWIEVFNNTPRNIINEAIELEYLTSSNYKGNLVKEENITNQNALEIAFNNLFEKPTFSWVKNSIIATPMYAFVGAFGLTNDLFLSNLIVYWTNILLIYAILNIVLVLFTKLTTLGQKKDKD